MRKEGRTLIIEVIFRDIETTQASFRDFIFRDVNPLGGTTKLRKLSAPNPVMKIVHGRLIHYLRGLKIDLSSATGARENCSPLNNVLRHRKNRYFYLTDIASAYSNVNRVKLAEIVFSLGENLAAQRGSSLFRFAADIDGALKFLDRFCISPAGGIRTGAPASPDLFNIYCAHLIDSGLRERCAAYGITYTRYLDDCTFSSNQPIGLRKRRALHKIIRAAGFQLANDKTKVLDLAKGTIQINGVGLELGGRVFVPRSYQRMLNARVHKLAPFEERYLSEISGGMGVFRSIIRGRGPAENKFDWRLQDAYGKYSNQLAEKRRARRAKNRSITRAIA